MAGQGGDAREMPTSKGQRRLRMDPGKLTREYSARVGDGEVAARARRAGVWATRAALELFPDGNVLCFAVVGPTRLPAAEYPYPTPTRVARLYSDRAFDDTRTVVSSMRWHNRRGRLHRLQLGETPSGIGLSNHRQFDALPTAVSRCAPSIFVVPLPLRC